MTTRQIRALSLATGLLLFARLAAADTVTIDFERFPGPDGQFGTADDVMPGSGLVLLTDQFSSLGLTFSQGTLGQSSFFDGNPGNHFLTSTSPIASLSVPVFGVSIETYSFWDATLTAFNVNNVVLGTATVENATPGLNPIRGILSFSSPVAIHQFSVLPPHRDHILNLDNLVLTTAEPVPEPSTLALVCIGGLLAAARRRRERMRASAAAMLLPDAR